VEGESCEKTWSGEIKKKIGPQLTGPNGKQSTAEEDGKRTPRQKKDGQMTSSISQGIQIIFCKKTRVNALKLTVAN